MKKEFPDSAVQNAARLIDAIYVKNFTPETDAQCRQAKAAWDALSSEEKQRLRGRNADPDYFGRDTGDCAHDDTLNQDGIGADELLAVSFGTSFNESRSRDIGGIEKALQAAFPDWAVRRAFTSQIIINHIQARDGVKTDNMAQAMQRAVKNGAKRLVIQPTHLMQGIEYDELCRTAAAYQKHFEAVAIAEPLLGAVGQNPAASNKDMQAAAKAVCAETVRLAGYSSMQQAEKDGIAFVFMGHGTAHYAKAAYCRMQAVLQQLGCRNAFIGTVEEDPPETSCANTIEKVHRAGYTSVILRPLMVVAGDHASNDMAGEDPDSWKSRFAASGYFGRIECQIEGLGRIGEIRQIYVEHSKEAMRALQKAEVPAPAKENS